MATLKFPAVKVTFPGEVHVSEADALEIADRINSAFATTSDECMVAILTDGLVRVIAQMGLTPAATLKFLATAVADASGGRLLVKVDAGRPIEARPERRPLGGHAPRRRRS